MSIDFLNHLHACGLHPIITLPTKVTDSSSTPIDNFLCDISSLSVSANVLKTDISDHYLIEVSLNLAATNNLVC